MELSLKDLQQVKGTLKRTPSPKAPLSPSSGENGAAPSNTGPSSVASFRNIFEQKPIPLFEDRGQHSEEKVMSVESTEAVFEQISFEKSTPPWKQTIGNQSKVDFFIQDKDSNTSNGEPPRKPLPPYFRIGSAPIKPAKPDHLKFRLKKYQDKFILAKGVATAAIASKEGRLKSKINRRYLITVQFHQYDLICAIKIYFMAGSGHVFKEILK